MTVHIYALFRFLIKIVFLLLTPKIYKKFIFANQNCANHVNIYEVDIVYGLYRHTFYMGFHMLGLTPTLLI